MLGAELERRGPEDERDEEEVERQIEGAEGRGVGLGEGREERAAEGDEPDLVAVPERPDGVHDEALLLVGLRDPQVHHAHAEVEAVEDGVADEQDAQEDEPDELKIHQSASSSLRSSLMRGPDASVRSAAASSTAWPPVTAAARAGASTRGGAGPFWIFSFITKTQTKKRSA